MMAPLHASDTGDVLEALDADERVRLVTMLGDRFDYSALTEVDDAIRTDLIEELPNEQVARGVSALDSDDAVYILEDIDVPAREEILAQMPAFERLSLKRSLDFPEDSAGRRMQTDFIAIPPFWTVGQTIDYLREESDLPDEFFQIYVVDPGYNLLGTLPLDKFLRAKRQVRIEDIMNKNVIEVEAGEDQEEAARMFERYDLVEVAVVDENKRLVGVLTVDDMVDVIHEEASEDIKLLAGVGDEELSDNVWSAVRSRATWLVVNLLTAMLASARDRAVRRHHRADGGARRADADRRLDGRQCRHADHDHHGARARHARTRSAPDRPADRARDDRSASSTAASSRC